MLLQEESLDRKNSLQLYCTKMTQKGAVSSEDAVMYFTHACAYRRIPLWLTNIFLGWSHRIRHWVLGNNVCIAWYPVIKLEKPGWSNLDLLPKDTHRTCNVNQIMLYIKDYRRGIKAAWVTHSLLWRVWTPSCILGRNIWNII